MMITNTTNHQAYDWCKRAADSLRLDFCFSFYALLCDIPYCRNGTIISDSYSCFHFLLVTYELEIHLLLYKYVDQLIEAKSSWNNLNPVTAIPVLVGTLAGYYKSEWHTHLDPR